MQPYSLKLTIDGLYGAFAEKYALRLTHAHRVHTLLLTLGARAKAGPITLLAPNPDPDTRRGQAHLLLPRFMKYYSKIKHTQPDRRFFLGISTSPTPPDDLDTLPHTLDGHDDLGPFTLSAFGTRATLSRPDAEPVDLSALDSPSHTTGDSTLHCHFGSFSDLFASPLEGLVTICEEAMAKDTEIIVTSLA